LNLPPGAGTGAEITNCTPGPFYKVKTCINLNKKMLVLKSKIKFTRYRTKLFGAGAAIRICGYTEPEPKEIFSDLQHWFILLYFHGKIFLPDKKSATNPSFFYTHIEYL
jgi:hypothetical protein